MANKKMKITIVNVHWNNRGDEAALLAMISGLRKVHPDSTITIPIKDTKSVEQFPDIEDVEVSVGQFKTPVWDIWISVLSRGLLGINKTLKRSIHAIKKSDFIIYGPGGSVINKRFFWIKQMEYLMPLICAKFYKIPMMVAAPSIGPFDTGKKNLLLKWLLKTPEVLCVREEISRKYLEEIGITKNVHVTIDSAFYDQVDANSNEQLLLQYAQLDDFLKSRKKVVGITITDFNWHVKYNKDQELSSRITDSFRSLVTDLESRNYGVVFLPQLFGNQNDHDYMSQFSSKSTFIIRDNMDTYFQQYVISKLYAVVGMRYHSNIFSAKMGTPLIAVVYEEKMQGFLELAELVDYSITLSELSASRIIAKFAKLESNYSHIRKQLEVQNEKWRDRAAETMAFFRRYK